MTQVLNTTAGREEQLGPLQMSEIILRTRQYDEMKRWYQRFFGGLKPAVENAPHGKLKSAPYVERLCFLRIHASYPYTQVLGIFETAQAPVTTGKGSGLDHMQFRESSLGNLLLRYEQLAADGVRPTHSYNHGPGTSFYYADPDGNVVELSASNFENEADYLAFFQTDTYRNNVEGVPVDPEAYAAEQRSAQALQP